MKQTETGRQRERGAFLLYYLLAISFTQIVNLKNKGQILPDNSTRIHVLSRPSAIRFQINLQEPDTYGLLG